MECRFCLKFVGCLKIWKMAQPTDWSVTTFLGQTAYLGFLRSIFSRSKHVGLINTSSRHASQLLSLVEIIRYRCDTSCDAWWHHTIPLVQSLRQPPWPTPCLLLSSKACRTCRHIFQTHISIIVTYQDNLVPPWHPLWHIMTSYNSAYTTSKAALLAHTMLALAIQSA